MEMPTSMPDTPIVLPSAISGPTASFTTMEPALTTDTQALKEIVYSPCISVDQSFPVNTEIPWNLLFMQERSIYILDPEDGTRMLVPYFSEKESDGSHKYSYDFSISPDGNWVAYQDTSRTKLYVEPADTLLTNQDQDRTVWENPISFWLSRWLDNDFVLVNYWKSQGDTFITSAFLNPFTGEIHEFLLDDLPNYKDDKAGGAVMVTHYFNSGDLVPDPTMKRILYPEIWNDNNYNTLWDIETKSPLARVKYIIDLFNDPLWLQDGSNVVLKSTVKDLWEEWFLVTANGDVRQITQFSDIFLEHNYLLSLPSRSKDGHFMEFRFSTYEQSENIAKYFVLDLKTNVLEGYCIPSRFHQNTSLDFPVWSPDSKYIIIPNTDMYLKGEIFLVDVDARAVYQIAEDLEVIGWIAKP
jgi:hypothetical protein